ncbi:hypothetical protein NCCP2331_01180 [Sporosarcina sp. NCCP-2331]|nr:hypothetical protein NCCP2331_01180 [Sporosarcina sp. NCCP-2331]GLB54746.1 hypothetical protein NCCP2378_05310 [Sporosarcina sp. NCCP-2378]
MIFISILHVNAPIKQSAEPKKPANEPKTAAAARNTSSNAPNYITNEPIRPFPAPNFSRRGRQRIYIPTIHVIKITTIASGAK